MGAVAQDADIIGCCVEDAVRTPFGVEHALAHHLPPGEERVAPGRDQLGGGDADGILVDRSQVDHQLQPGGVGAVQPRLVDIELQVLGARQVEARGAQRCNERAPPRLERARLQRPRRRPVVTHEPAGGVRVERGPQHGLELVARPGQHDGGVDVLRPELYRAAVGTWHQVLPGHLHRVVRVEVADPERRVESIGRLRSRREAPVGLSQ